MHASMSALCAGIELASSCQVHMAHPGGMLMLITAAAILALKNTGLGFLAGVQTTLELFPVLQCHFCARKRSEPLPNLSTRMRSQCVHT